MGVSWSSPRPIAATFLLGTCGVSLLGPCCETETKGASPSYTMPPLPCLGTAVWDQRPGKYQHVLESNPRALLKEKEKKELLVHA